LGDILADFFLHAHLVTLAASAAKSTSGFRPPESLNNARTRSPDLSGLAQTRVSANDCVEVRICQLFRADRIYQFLGFTSFSDLPVSRIYQFLGPSLAGLFRHGCQVCFIKKL
jgi:hypothetical protein